MKFLLGIANFFVKLIKLFLYLIAGCLLLAATFYLIVQIFSWVAPTGFRNDIPSELHVSRALFSNEKAFGFGPGGNETGIFIYRFSASVAEQIINQDGMHALHMPDDTNTGWRETPLQGTESWSNGVDVIDGVHLADYLDRYGFGIEIDHDLEKQIDDALIKSGSYYTYTRHGLLIVIPEHRLVVFAYAG